MPKSYTNFKLPKYQTINYSAIDEGVFAYVPKEDKPNDTIPLPKCIRLEYPIKPCTADLFLCSTFEKVTVNGTNGKRTGGRKITGLFPTIKEDIWSGDIWQRNGKKSTILCNFNLHDDETLFNADWLKIYNFFNFYVAPKNIDEFVYKMFYVMYKIGWSF